MSDGNPDSKGHPKQAPLKKWFDKLKRNNGQDEFEEDILTMVNEGQETGAIEDGEAQMIAGIFALDDKEARDIMTHRTQITGIEDVMTLEDALHFMLDSNYSRFPVYEENIDKVQGIVHLKDVCRECQNEDQRDKALKDIDGLIREVQYVPETRKIDELFRQMQHSKSQMVIVIDEYGQTAGLIAMEDILEEIVGDIKDEYDEEQNQIQQKGQDRFVIDGMSKLEDLEKQFGISFDEEFFDTMNGFMISKMDRIPEVGDQFSVEVDGYLFQIMKVKNHKIDKVTVRKLEKKDTENGEK
ncbi:MAG: HlyC/CorC family transporter [Lachnospiraceae bacterium]|jgi:putative hemolysin|nr:HlyC/CorC family transporter [Lachnospiraceae bacterium]